MAENSKIEWTHHTFNPWRGCTKVSPGCANCYAEALSGRNPKVLGVWGPTGTRVVAAESYWRQPLKWDRDAKAAGERRRVFCASLADVFEDWSGPMAGPGLDADGSPGLGWPRRGDTAGGPVTMDDVRIRLFDVIRQTPHLDWLLLTKRPQNVIPALRRCLDRMREFGWSIVPQPPSPHDREYHLPSWINGWLHGDSPQFGHVVPANVWLGTSVEDQPRAAERIPYLLRCPAAVRFLSCEPLLGPVDLTRWLTKPLQINQYRRSRVSLDPQVRHDSAKKDDAVSHPAQFPASNRFPSAASSVVIPPDSAAYDSGQPFGDRAVGRVDGDPGAISPAGSSPPVQIPFAVEQSGDVTEGRRIAGDSDGLRPQQRAGSTQDAGSSQPSLDGGPGSTEPARHVNDGGPGPVSGNDATKRQCDSLHAPHCINWVIVGGESGPGARPMHTEWAKSLVGQCKATGVACFVKQLGANPQEWFCGDQPAVHDAPRLQGDLKLRDRKGGDMAEWPADLCVRQFPEVTR